MQIAPMGFNASLPPPAIRGEPRSTSIRGGLLGLDLVLKDVNLGAKDIDILEGKN